MNILIAGGRDFNDYKKADNAWWFTVNEQDLFLEDITIVSGACDSNKGVLTFTRPDGKKIYGADGVGESLAKDYGYPVKSFPADWKKFSNSAGPIRNEEMAKIINRALIFWDGKSKGSLNMINNCNKYKVPLTIIEY